MQRTYPVKKDKEDARDHVFARAPLAYNLPQSMDLRPGCSPVVDQLNLGSCTSNAWCSGLREFMMLKSGMKLVRLSRRYHYYKEREIEGTINEDSGASIRVGAKVLVGQGVCSEATWPYVVEQFTQQPSAQADAEALNFRVSSYQRITTQDGIKRSLYEGYPVTIGMAVYESFESDEVARTGKVPMPKKGEQNLGGHAVLIVGYVDTGKTLFGRKTGYFIVRNSWGEGWGDKGYFYLPYEFVAKYCFDFWTVR